jgi:hypothetical protein
LGETLYLLVPFATDFGVDVQGFNALFQPVLFSTVTDYGLGSNIWAEMLASGGWLMLVTFLCVYCAIIVAGDALIRRLPVHLSVITLTILAYWCFYIHRNDLVYEITLMRRTALVSLAILAVAYLLRLAGSGIRSAVGVVGVRRPGAPPVAWHDSP